MPPQNELVDNVAEKLVVLAEPAASPMTVAQFTAFLVAVALRNQRKGYGSIAYALLKRMQWNGSRTPLL